MVIIETRQAKCLLQCGALAQATDAQGSKSGCLQLPNKGCVRAPHTENLYLFGLVLCRRYVGVLCLGEFAFGVRRLTSKNLRVFVVMFAKIGDFACNVNCDRTRLHAW